MNISAPASLPFERASDDAEVTATTKVRRKSIAEKYARTIDDLHA